MRHKTHNLRRALYLLVALPLLLVACEPSNPENKPSNRPKEDKNPVLHFTPQRMTLSAEGGEVCITYSIDNAKEGVKLEATCEATWVGDIVVDKQSITFDVDANEYDERTTVVTLSYDNIVEEVSITQEALEGINFEATILTGWYYSAESLYWNAHNYYFVLSDAVIDRSNPTPNSTYFYFDLYTEEATEDYSIPQGRYSFDAEHLWLAGTVNGGKTYGFKINADCTGYAEQYIFTDGEVVVGEHSIEAWFMRDNGQRVTISYEGDLIIENASPEDEEEYLSTLSEDVNLNITNAIVSANYYGDYYTSDSDNWTIRLYEDTERMNGLFIQLELLTDPTADSWQLNYNALQDSSLSNPEDYINTYIKGYIQDNNIAGSWYAVLKDGAINYQMAPIMDGSIDIVLNEDGSNIFTFNCVDDAGYKITGSVISGATN